MQGYRSNGPSFDIEVQKCSSRCFGCVMQAEPEPISASGSEGGLTTTQTTTFMDEMEGVTAGMSAICNEYEGQDMVVSADLQDFLSRPVRIANFTWLESDATATTTTFDPWSLFFNNAQIKYKLNNYAFLRCNLKVKIIVNASPFYYGAMRACYQPLPNFKSNTITTDVSGGLAHLIPYSQQPGLWIHPQHSEGGELTLPFFYPKNYLRIGFAADVADMGLLKLITYTPLASANGATGQGVTVQMYAWAEDVSLAGPTLALAMQAQDEYGMGPISGPASTVAKYASLVRGIPIIGKFATATEMGARAVGGIAKLFGYTNVPVIAPAQPFRPSPFPQLASCEIGYPIEKLTLDPKNELTIDPSSVGLKSDDELALEYIATRDSLIARTSWSTTTVVDTPLFTSIVTPMQFNNNGQAVNVVYLTPLAMLTKLFTHWRGDIIFTFKVVASPYHKGRLRISYDPASNSVQTAGDVGSAIFNTVVDIGEQTEVEVRIPYQQALAWMQCNSSLSTGNQPWTASGSPSLSANDSFHNGIISLKVLTLLTAPVATSTVSILVFVRGAENIEFANPCDLDAYVSNFTVQAQPEPAQLPMGETTDKPLMERNRVHFGETVRSLRQILRRSCWSQTIFPGAADTNAISLQKMRMSRWPSPYGFDPNGLNSAKGVIATGSNFPFSYAKMLPYHWITNCFIGIRGSGHIHFNIQDGGPITNVVVSRRNHAEGTPLVGANSTALGTQSSNARAYFVDTPPTAGGSAITNQYTQSGLSVSVPSFTQYKFQSAALSNIMSPPLTGTDLTDGSSLELIDVTIHCDGATTAQSRSNVRLHKFTAVGTDFNVFFFLNVPTWNILASVPVAN